eukprot:TRINITY_DN11257_c0_g1_i1.p1 TRINITY_DN11257_c0_g1~~TRINITY_DN11257_c0_g1_i1.p1  ORF type:complete len:482 (-),score=99.55 TRINITY_DN11257_c0_g1_i1:136-1581(-)
MEGTRSATAPPPPPPPPAAVGGTSSYVPSASASSSSASGAVLPSPPIIPSFPPRTAPAWTLPFPMPEEMFEAVQKIMAGVERQTNAAEAAQQQQQRQQQTEQQSDSEEESSAVNVNRRGTSGGNATNGGEGVVAHSFWLSPPAVIDAHTDEYDDVLHAHAAKSRNPVDALSTVETNGRFFSPEYSQGVRVEAKKAVDAQQKLAAAGSAMGGSTNIFQRGVGGATAGSSVLQSATQKPNFDVFLQQQQISSQQRAQMSQAQAAQRTVQRPAAGGQVSGGAAPVAAAAPPPSAGSVTAGKSPPDSAGSKRKRTKHAGMVPKQKIARGEMWECKVCKKDVKPNKMREHVGSHIMDEGCTSPDACGFCGRSGSCTVTLLQGSAKNIQVPFSQCEYYYKFNLKSALKDQSACSNVPYQCPACFELERKTVHVWKYNMRSHLRQRHPRYSPTAEFMALINVTSDEQSRMKEYHTSGYTGGADYDDDD